MVAARVRLELERVTDAFDGLPAAGLKDLRGPGFRCQPLRCQQLTRLTDNAGSVGHDKAGDHAKLKTDKTAAAHKTAAWRNPWNRAGTSAAAQRLLVDYR